MRCLKKGVIEAELSFQGRYSGCEVRYPSWPSTPGSGFDNR